MVGSGRHATIAQRKSHPKVAFGSNTAGLFGAAHFTIHKVILLQGSFPPF